ncbi:MAG TPA: PAS domain S-box protein [Anaerolineales bacterium]
MNNHPLSTVSSKINSGPLKIAGLYLLLGGLWILFSDRLAAQITSDPALLTRISLYKGWGYVFVTALLLYWLIRRQITALRGGEEQLRLITDALPALISYVDSDKRYQFTNQAYEEWFGHQTQGKHIEEVLGKAAYKTISGYIDTALKGETVTYETEIPYKDGGTRFINATYVPDSGTNGQIKGFFALVQDITESKQAEEELRQWADAFEGCAHGIAIDDPSTNRIVVCNPAFARMHKSRVEDLVGTGILSLYALPDHEHVRRSIERADQIGHSQFEARSIRKDGSTFPVQMDVVSVWGNDGDLLHRVVTAVDVTERKQSEEALVESEARWNGVIQSAMDAIISVDSEQRIVLFNVAAEKMFGCTASQAMGHPLEHFIPERFRAAHYQHVQNYGATGVTNRDKRGSAVVFGRRSNGDEFPSEASISQVEIAGKKLYTVILRDITERKQTEETLEYKDELLRMTSEIAKVGGWEFDATTLRGTWTDQVARIHDLDPALETNVELGLSFYTGESRRKIEKAVKESIELAKPYDLELEMLTAKGNHKWVRTMGLPTMEDGKVVKVRGIFQDVTERKQAEEALQRAHDQLETKVQERTAALSQANALLQALLDYMPDHIYFKDTQSRFIRNSKSQAKMLGLSDPSQVVGKTDFDFFPHAAQAYAEEQEVMRSGKPLVDFEERVIWPDGRETWVSTTKVPLPNSDGQIIGIFGISRDITERKRGEQAIQQLNADLKKQAEQLEAANKELEAFSYSVSHDLRAPLRAIDGFTRILLEDYEPLLEEEGKRVCEIIRREAQHMGELIDDLLTFSRLGRKEMHFTKIDMKAMAGSVFDELMKTENAARIDFHIHRLPSTAGDPVLIRQVWVNLLSNAIKFSSKKERAVIEVGSKHSEDEHVYYVRDTGAGFELEYVDKLFGVFQRLHGEKEFEGTGVGLAIVKRVINRHGGRVWAEGEVDKGATFYFALPRKRE